MHLFYLNLFDACFCVAQFFFDSNDLFRQDVFYLCMLLCCFHLLPVFLPGGQPRATWPLGGFPCLSFVWATFHRRWRRKTHHRLLCRHRLLESSRRWAPKVLSNATQTFMLWCFPTWQARLGDDLCPFVSSLLKRYGQGPDWILPGCDCSLFEMPWCLNGPSPTQESTNFEVNCPCIHEVRFLST